MMAVGLWLNGAFQRHIELLISYFFMTANDVIDDVVIFDKFSHATFRNAIGVPVTRVDTSFQGSWQNKLDDAVSVLEYNDIDTLIIFKTDLRDNFRYKKETGGRTLIKGSHKDDMYSSTFLSSKAQLENLKFVEAASIVCDNVYQYALDPDEARLDVLFNFKNFARLYFNECKRQNSVFIPYHEYSMVREYGLIDTDDKSLFCFHATANNDRRKWLADMKEELESEPTYNCKIKVRNSRGTSYQREYMQILQHSLYTLVIDSYDPDAFSWPRLFEAVACGCLPLVMSDCNLQDIENIYPDLYDIITSELLVDSFDDVKIRIKKMPEKKRQQLVSDIMTSDSVRKITDLDWLNDRWNTLEGLGGTN